MIKMWVFQLLMHLVVVLIQLKALLLFIFCLHSNLQHFHKSLFNFVSTPLKIIKISWVWTRFIKTQLKNLLPLTQIRSAICLMREKNTKGGKFNVDKLKKTENIIFI